MTKIVYYDYYDSNELLEDFGFENFIEECRPSTSNWWSGLNFFLDGVKSVSEYIENRKRMYIEGKLPYDEDLNDVTCTTIKNCPGIKGLFKNTYLLKAPCDFHLSFNDVEGEFIRMFLPSDKDLMMCTGHDRDQFMSSTNNIFGNKKNFKLHFPIKIKYDKVDCLVLQPQYHQDLPWTVMQGVLSRDLKYCEMNINCLSDAKEMNVFVPKGTPICYLYFTEKVKFVRDKKLGSYRSLTPTFVNRYKNM